MSRVRTFKFRSILALLLLWLLMTPTVFADAVADISIASQGACASGGTAFFITNSNTANGVNATLTRTSVVSGTPDSSTVQVSSSMVTRLPGIGSHPFHLLALGARPTLADRAPAGGDVRIAIVGADRAHVFGA